VQIYSEQEDRLAAAVRSACRGCIRAVVDWVAKSRSGVGDVKLLKKLAKQAGEDAIPLTASRELLDAVEDISEKAYRRGVHQAYAALRQCLQDKPHEQWPGYIDAAFADAGKMRFARGDFDFLTHGLFRRVDDAVTRRRAAAAGDAA
jgi:hypothetical protein